MEIKFGYLNTRTGAKSIPESEEKDATLKYLKMDKKSRKRARSDPQMSGLFRKFNPTNKNEKFKNGPPSLEFNVYNFFERKNCGTLDVRYIKQLLLYSFSKCSPPEWAKLKNNKSVKDVILITVDGLGQIFLEKKGNDFSLLDKIFKNAIPVNIPYSFRDDCNTLRYYERCNASVKGLKVQTKEKNVPVKLKNKVSLSEFLMSEKQRKENEFPPKESLEKDKQFFKLETRPENSLETKLKNSLKSNLSQFKKVEAEKERFEHIVGIDCEMVETKSGSELARCTVVDFSGNTIYDSYVRPEEDVIDYRTQFSGIDAAVLSKTEKRLSDVQSDLKKILFSDTIICGHSLENDLAALKLYHERAIDTSVLYPHQNGHPMKLSLRFLSKRFLKQNIQQSSQGHNSAEDAAATIDLVKLKFNNGIHFGFKHNFFESIFSIARRDQRLSAMIADETKLKAIAANNTFVDCIISNGVKETVEKATKLIKSKDENGRKKFVWVHFGYFGNTPNNGNENNEIEHGLNNEIKKEDKSEKGLNSKESKSNKEQSKFEPKFEFSPKEIDGAIEEVFNACEKDSLVFVMSGQLKNGAMKKMNERRTKWIKKEEVKWPEEEEYAKGLALLKKGVCLVALK